MKFGDRSVLKFLVAGGLNTGLTYLLYLFLLQYAPYIWAYSLTYVCGIAFGYLLNAFWVFKRKPDLQSMLTYPLAYVVNYALGVFLLWLLVGQLKLSKELGPLVAIAVSVPVMYIFTRSIFRGKKYSGSETEHQ